MEHMRDDVSGLKLLGSGSMPKITGAPDRAILEVFPNRFPQRMYVISIVFPEFTSLCPVTGQPDFGTIAVEYIPGPLCVESKSFKLYMFAYRSHPSFMETITNGILEDVMAVASPRWCQVRGLFAPRGATRIHVFTEEYGHFPEEEMALARRAANDWLQRPNPERLA